MQSYLVNVARTHFLRGETRLSFQCIKTNILKREMPERHSKVPGSICRTTKSIRKKGGGLTTKNNTPQPDTKLPTALIIIPSVCETQVDP